MNNINKITNLKGKTALVTGAAGYLGKKIVAALDELGANLIVTDISKESLKLYNKKKYKIISCDLSNESERNKFIKKITKLDILINNAAYVGTSNLKGWNTEFKNQNVDTWREAIEVNLTTPFHLIKDFSDLLKKGNNSSVINISSIYGHVAPDYSIYKGTKMNNPAAYAISKAGINQLTKWSASTLSPKVRVNTISIGGIFRNQDKKFIKKYVSRTLLGRMANETDIIGGVIYFSTDLSNYVTGQNLFIDGGFTV